MDCAFVMIAVKKYGPGVEMPVAAIAAETLFVPDLTLAREHLAITIILNGLLTS